MQEMPEVVRNDLPVPVRHAHVVVHRAAIVPQHALVDWNPAGVHFAKRPLPCVVFFKAAGRIAMEADGVVADFVEEDCSGDGAAWRGAAMRRLMRPSRNFSSYAMPAMWVCHLRMEIL